MTKTVLGRFTDSSFDNRKPVPPVESEQALKGRERLQSGSAIEKPRHKPTWFELAIITLMIEICMTWARAQAAAGPHVIGVLSPSSSAAYSLRVEALRQSLNKLGYIDGKNVNIEYRYANGNMKQLYGLAVELMDRKVELIVTSSATAIESIAKANPRLPVVFAAIGPDPVESGFAASLARPGGNITGITIFAPELDGKRLALLRETLPKITRVGFLQAAGKRGDQAFANLKPSANAMGIQLTPIKVKSAEDLDRAIETGKSGGVSALAVMPLPLFTAQQKRIVDLISKHRLPAIFSNADFVEAGAFMSYGPNLIENYRRAAVYVDKILKGAKPGDLPIEQPTKFEFVVNLKSAKQIGLTIPPNVLVRADRVIR
jgi:putative ABC transport system substrate-binding protein